MPVRRGREQGAPPASVTNHAIMDDYLRGWQSLVMDRQTWQGHYGESVVQAMACAAGLVPTKRSLDVDGVDFHIVHPGRLGARRHPAIDVQVKSWSSPRVVDGELAYPLPRLNYDNLVGRVGDDFPLSRLLFLVTVPNDNGQYMTVGDDSISMFHRVFWVSIMHYPELGVDENATSKTVYIPIENVLTPDVLRDLLCRDYEQGGRP